MKKHKKPQGGKKKSPGRASTSLRQVGRSLGRLSTTQKVVGSTLLALGLGYVAQQRRKGATALPTPADSPSAE